MHEKVFEKGMIPKHLQLSSLHACLWKLEPFWNTWAEEQNGWRSDYWAQATSSICVLTGVSMPGGESWLHSQNASVNKTASSSVLHWLFSCFYFHVNMQQRRTKLQLKHSLTRRLCLYQLSFMSFKKYKVCFKFWKNNMCKKQRQAASAPVKHMLNGTDFRGAATSTSTVLIEGKHAESLQGDMRTVTTSNAHTLVCWVHLRDYSLTRITVKKT